MSLRKTDVHMTTRSVRLRPFVRESSPPARRLLSRHPTRPQSPGLGVHTGSCESFALATCLAVLARSVPTDQCRAFAQTNLVASYPVVLLFQYGSDAVRRSAKTCVAKLRVIVPEFITVDPTHAVDDESAPCTSTVPQGMFGCRPLHFHADSILKNADGCVGVAVTA